MVKPLKINLNTQREILQEGAQKSISVSAGPQLRVGRMKTDFFLPELNLGVSKDAPKKSSPQVQKVVSRINKFIENIADDYFLLGLHFHSMSFGFLSNFLNK